MNIERICLRCMEAEPGPDGICPACGGACLTEQQPGNALPLRTILHGRYLIGSVLGRGGFGVTYLAYDLPVGKKVVVKELFPTTLVSRVPGSTEIVIEKDPDFFLKSRQRFVNEARVIYSLREIPEIVDVYHAFIENNTGYYSMEFLNGSTLQAEIKKTKAPLSWDRLAPIAEKTAAALRAVHRKGNIHRDVSPDNIFVLPNGEVKLIDFGAASRYGNGRAFTEILKKGFAPYEQYQRNGNQGPWTDIYAFAATIYYCLTKKLVPEAPARIIQDHLLPPSSLGAVLPREKEHALMQALRLQPDSRFSSIEAFMTALGLRLRPLLPAETGETPTSGSPASRWYLRGIHGEYAGKKIFLNGTLTLGRDPAKCELVYPQDAPGVSRVMLTVSPAGEGVFRLRCESATQKIFVNGIVVGGQGAGVDLQLGDRFVFGQNQIFVLERQD